MRERIYQYLKHRILEGDIPPGQRLVESQLASEVGTSRTPIREALHNLEFEKLIKAIPKVGYVVSDITESDVREICEIRVVLESLAIRWALENKDSDLVLKLRSNLDQMEDYINKHKLKKIPELDSEFHDLICQASGSTWLTDLNQYLREYMLRLRVKCLTKRKLATRALQGHSGILRALEIQDAKSAENAIRHHMDITMEDIISQTFRPDSKENRPTLLTSLGKLRKGI
jgi:DNA-binding GntR family transcriptional regulator